MRSLSCTHVLSIATTAVTAAVAPSFLCCDASNGMPCCVPTGTAEAGPTPATQEASQTLVLPEVPNVWDQLTSTTEATLAPSEDVQYMEGEDDSNLANDAMLLIMHAVRARSQGRSLGEERRATAEQYWRQAEEQDEAQLFRAGGEAPTS